MMRDEKNYVGEIIGNSERIGVCCLYVLSLRISKTRIRWYLKVHTIFLLCKHSIFLLGTHNPQTYLCTRNL